MSDVDLIGTRAWWAWLTSPSRSKGGGDICSSTRFEAVGHRRALSLKWALTVGLWGGAFTRDQIWAVARPRSNQVWSEFLRSWKVRARVDHSLWAGGVVTRASLVQRVSSMFRDLEPRLGRGEALRSVARVFHILPVDVAVMSNHLECLLDDRGQEALDYWGDDTPEAEAERQQQWDDWDPLPAAVMEHWLKILAGRDDPHGPNRKYARDFAPGA